MRSYNWKFYLRTRQQQLAAFTVLLMLALGLILGRHDYDQPHMHVDNESSWPTTMAPSMYTNGTPSSVTFSSSSYLGAWRDALS